MASKKLGTPAIIAAAIGGSLLLFLLLSAYGVFNSFLSWDARQAGFGWKLLGLIPLAFSAVMVYRMATNRVDPTRQIIVATLIGLALSICADVGFKFTGGDIKQRITPFDNLGKVVHKDVLYEYYDDFYHFSTDTALKNYVETYGELPGRNNWNYFILAGKTPKSTAPRADELFEWHTGAYDMDLHK